MNCSICCKIRDYLDKEFLGMKNMYYLIFRQLGFVTFIKNGYQNIGGEV